MILSGLGVSQTAHGPRQTEVSPVSSVANALGFVRISRRRGRIAGWAKPRIPVQILWCGTNRPRKKYGQRRNGWSFPPAVRELLLQECQGQTVLHLFGGMADFGIRMDIDVRTQPHVIGDAYLPPFARDSFDVVILDPPYTRMGQQEKVALLRAAAWIARRRVIWFHTVWIECDRYISLERAWLVGVGTQCSVRCLQFFEIKEPKHAPVARFERGPAIKYNRWLSGNAVLPFDSPAPRSDSNIQESGQRLSTRFDDPRLIRAAGQNAAQER